MTVWTVMKVKGLKEQTYAFNGGMQTNVWLSIFHVALPFPIALNLLATLLQSWVSVHTPCLALPMLS